MFLVSKKQNIWISLAAYRTGIDLFYIYPPQMYVVFNSLGINTTPTLNLLAMWSKNLVDKNWFSNTLDDSQFT